MPTELDELNRKVMQLEIEETALKKEEDNLSKERLENLQKELAELRSEFQTKKAQWDNEKKAVERVQKLREELEALNKEIQTAQQNYDLEKAAELQYGKKPQLEKELAHEEEIVKNKDMSLVHESVSEDEIARIISRWTGIPVAKLTESERNKTFIWTKNCTNVSSDRMKVSQKLLKQSFVPKPESKIRASRSVRSSSLDLPESVKQNWQKH